MKDIYDLTDELNESLDPERADPDIVFFWVMCDKSTARSSFGARFETEESILTDSLVSVFLENEHIYSAVQEAIEWTKQRLERDAEIEVLKKRMTKKPD